MEILRTVLGVKDGESNTVILDKIRDLQDCNPCQSCGAKPNVTPPTGQELPIVRGALDAQYAAEREAFELKQKVARMEADREARCVASDRIHDALRAAGVSPDADGVRELVTRATGDCTADGKRRAFIPGEGWIVLSERKAWDDV
jgi:hypothetical protein